ncbi:uncharacterized protein NECHADRAFT_85064 [Fusarium vanettenii 77-13-4]|uniref:Uncharacterized protein n=1 Tax=Fusarium vanettenii (strain ATCC MYA-4622 / CBS 123669 / FGSC 9596 / NRRL 45880 / 77-13-4) TaxID=660122 RepID=C7YUW5_FUSV7|nr:uncharacterized protein NECHADRAFT_85064 [Fusarium vanettenii 77-13-4]EEU44878.1 predicted protein [Fusarium vanettenii 77-13-4]
MDKQQSGAYRAHKRASGNYKPPTCEDATATDMSDSQPERPTRQHHRDGAEARQPLQPTTANVPSSSRFPGQATGQPTYQQSGYTGHPFAPVQSTYNPNPLYGGSAVPMSYPSTYQTPSYPGRYASNTSVPYTYPGQYAQPPYIYPPTTQPSVGYDDPRRYSYGDEYYQPEPTNTYPSRPPPRAPRPPRVTYGYEQRSATPAPKTERPPPPKKKVPARPATARPAEDNAGQDKLIKEIGKMRRQIKKLEMGQEDLLSDTGRVRSEFMLPSASLAGRASSVESVQTLEHIRRIIDDCLRKTGRESSYYGDSGVGAIEALIRDKLASERRESMEPKDDRSFRRRVIEVLQDFETQDGRWERRSTTGGSTTREEKRRSGGQRSTTSSDPPLEPVTPPSNYSMPQRTGKASSVSPEDGRSRDVEYIYETRPRGGTSRAVHSDEETISRPPITRRPEASYQGGGTGRARRRSMVEPERGSYGRPRVYHGTEEVVDDYEDDRPQRRRTVVYPDRRPTPYSGGGLGQRFRTDPTSAPSSSTRWSRDGGVYDAR